MALANLYYAPTVAATGFRMRASAGYSREEQVAFEFVPTKFSTGKWHLRGYDVSIREGHRLAMVVYPENPNAYVAWNGWKTRKAAPAAIEPLRAWLKELV